MPLWFVDNIVDALMIGEKKILVNEVSSIDIDEDTTTAMSSTRDDDDEEAQERVSLTSADYNNNNNSVSPSGSNDDNLTLSELLWEDDDSVALTINKLLCAHGTFALGSFLATLEGLYDLHDAIEYVHNPSSYYDDDDDDYDDDGDAAVISRLDMADSDESSSKIPFDNIINPAARRMLVYWTIPKVLLVASTFMYLLNAVTHIVTEEQCCSSSSSRSRNNRNHNHSKGFYISVTFGLAATCDLMGACLYDDDVDPWPSYVGGALAVYLYLLSAILTLYNHERAICGAFRFRELWNLIHCCRYSSSSSSSSAVAAAETTSSASARAALWLGDWLFLAGSLIDVAINNVDIPMDGWATPQRDLWIAIFGILSALLWFADSVIYLAADLYDIGDDDDDSYSEYSEEDGIIGSNDDDEDDHHGGLVQQDEFLIVNDDNANNNHREKQKQDGNDDHRVGLLLVTQPRGSSDQRKIQQQRTYSQPERRAPSITSTISSRSSKRDANGGGEISDQSTSAAASSTAIV